MRIVLSCHLCQGFLKKAHPGLVCLITSIWHKKICCDTSQSAKRLGVFRVRSLARRPLSASKPTSSYRKGCIQMRKNTLFNHLRFQGVPLAARHIVILAMLSVILAAGAFVCHLLEDVA